MRTIQVEEWVCVGQGLKELRLAIEVLNIADLPSTLQHFATLMGILRKADRNCAQCAAWLMLINKATVQTNTQPSTPGTH